MNKRQVSVIVPFYNREDYIDECISSVLKQSYPFFELILINDGSDDNSKYICSQFKDFRIRYLETPHLGCWKAKNLGIKEAKSDFVMFIDSDDMISPDYLKIAMETAEKHPESDYFYETAIDIMNEDSTSTNTIWRYLNYPGDERKRLINLFYQHQIGGIPHAGALIKKDVFDRFGYYEELDNLSDTVYVVKNALNINFYMVENLRHYYNRQHDKQTNKNLYARHKAFSDLLDYIFESFAPEIVDPALNACAEKDISFCYFNKFMECSDKYPEYKDLYLMHAKKYLKKHRDADL